MKLSDHKRHKQINKHLGQLKPFTFPQDFILVQDTREQQPLFPIEIKKQKEFEGLVVINRTLHNGDYSVKGFEDLICFERKKLSDFYGYIAKDRENTVKKMYKFQAMIDMGGFVGLLIEQSEEEVLFGLDMSQVSPEAARQALVSFEIRYHIHVYYNKSRNELRRWMLDRAIKWYNVKREVSNEIS